MRVVSADESRALDVRTIAAGTPGIVLMKRAANAVVREIAGVLVRRPSLAARVVVLAGPGNNGGDGFEVARLLMASRLASNVETILLGNPLHLTPDARKTYHRLEQVGGAIREVNDARELEPLAVATLVVDALFGTGLKRRVAPDGLPARAIALASSGRAFVVSIDLPSGLSADERDAVGAVRAGRPHRDVRLAEALPRGARSGRALRTRSPWRISASSSRPSPPRAKRSRSETWRPFSRAVPPRRTRARTGAFSSWAAPAGWPARPRSRAARLIGPERVS